MTKTVYVAVASSANLTTVPHSPKTPEIMPASHKNAVTNVDIAENPSAPRAERVLSRHVKIVLHYLSGPRVLKCITASNNPRHFPISPSMPCGSCRQGSLRHQTDSFFL